MNSYEKYYYELLKRLAWLKKCHLYNIPRIKGILFKYYSKKANASFVELTAKELERILPDINSNIVVSLTTYGERTRLVHITIDTLLNQSVKPQKVILWLSENEFPNGYKDVPDDLINRANSCPLFEIAFCEDLKPHKKYYETMKQYPECIVVTADDDVFYPSNWLESLIHLNEEHHDAICCTIAHKMGIDSNGMIADYSEWTHQTEETGPSIWLCPVGVGGVLYPPSALNKCVFEKEHIINTCLNADDLWLKVMSLLNHTLVIRTSEFGYGFLSVNGSEKTALSKSNVKGKKNDIQLRNIMNIYGDRIRKVLEDDLRGNISRS